MPDMSEYWTKLAANLRAGLADDAAFFSAAPEPNAEPMPDPVDCRPELDVLAAMAKEGCRGVVDLDDADWCVVCDELTYQIASALRKNESIVLPNIGKLEIVYGEGGSWGRLTLDEAARPEVLL